ncbi:hypothetical protein T484DRAFT_1948144 [Baffinella frigidus]|nr:hypothetical protein T484DRAFT_1948144 [Cryptophyta sp. CCMP2293]
MKMSLSLRCDTRELAGRKSALGAAVEAALQNVVTEFGCREVKVEWTRVAPSEDTKQKVRKKSNKKGEDADVAKRKTDEEGEGGEAPVAKKKARGDGPGRGNASKGSHPEGITPPKYAQIIRALREAAGEGPTVARVLSKIPDGSKFAAESRLLYALSILKNQFKCVTSAGQGDDQLWFAVDGV